MHLILSEGSIIFTILNMPTYKFNIGMGRRPELSVCLSISIIN